MNSAIQLSMKPSKESVGSKDCNGLIMWKKPSGRLRERCNNWKKIEVEWEGLQFILDFNRGQNFSIFCSIHDQGLSCEWIQQMHQYCNRLKKINKYDLCLLVSQLSKLLLARCLLLPSLQHCLRVPSQRARPLQVLARARLSRIPLLRFGACALL